MPTLEARHQVVALIRNFKPDLVLTHRPNDYHPDHRYTSQLVQDAAYVVTVPYYVPSAPFLAKDPVIAYLPDFFQKPTPFEPTVAIDVGPVVDKIVAHAAQPHVAVLRMAAVQPRRRRQGPARRMPAAAAI